MIENGKPRIAELLANRELIAEALERGAREAVLGHARAGRPVATWENGEVVWLPPDEIFRRYGEAPVPAVLVERTSARLPESRATVEIAGERSDA